jgi:hypothetical protein
MTARTFAIASCLAMAVGGSATAGEPGFAFKLGDNWRVPPMWRPATRRRWAA